MTGQRRRATVLAIVLMGYLLVLIDVSILMVALPRIHRDLGFSSSNLSWAQNAYTLTFGGLLLLGARAGDLLGRRRTFTLGIAIFMVASAAVGLAQSPAWMIVARALQGVGAAALAPSTLALLSTSFPAGPQRTRAMAAYGALAGIGTALGLIIGGALTQAWSWRVGFFINVPVGLIAILAAPQFIQETEPHERHLDAAAAITSTLGVSALVFGIVHSTDAGWTDPITLLALVVGIVLIGVFVIGQRTAAQPIMPLRLFADPERAGAYAARFLFNGALVSFFFFMTQYLQGVSGDRPLTAGLAFMPVTIAAFVAATATSRLTGWLSTGVMASLGCAAMLLGAAWMSFLSPSTGYLGGLVVPMVIFGLGQGLGLSTLTTTGMAGVDSRDASVAGGLVNVSHHLGGAVGLGILTTLFVAAGGHETGRALLSSRVSASLTGAAVLLALALTITVLTQLATRRGRSLTAYDAAAHSTCEPQRVAA
jgi:EmrB/QacA subfamily drug resistance transporter